MGIINHPACTAILNAPSDITDGSCDVLPVAEIESEHGLFSVSFWKPDLADLNVLNAGGSIALWVRAKGRQHPVVAVDVDSWEYKEPQ